MRGDRSTDPDLQGATDLVGSKTRRLGNNGGHPVEWAPEISTWVSLGVIVLAMVVATVASVLASRREKAVTPSTEE